MEKQNWKDFAADLKRRPKPTIPGRPYYAEMSDEDAVEAAFKMVPAKREVVDTSGLAEAKMATVVPAAKILQPAGRAFFTKEAQFGKLTDMVRSKEEQAKQQAILKNSRAADLARFQSLPKEERNKFNNDFENWVPTVYSSRTKGLAQIQNDANQKSGDTARFKQREAPGMLTRGARAFNDFAASSAIPGSDGKNSLYKLNDFAYQLAGGQSKEDRDLATYQRLKSPVRDMGVGETISETGKGMIDAGFVGTVREMFSPDEMGTNALNFVPIAGPVGGVTKGLQLANRFGAGTRVAAKLPSLVKSSSKVMEKALGTHLAGATGGVLAGGTTGMALGENGGLQDFAVGAGMGAVGQGVGSLVAAGVGKGVKGAKALFGSKPVPEVPPAPFHGEIESRLREKMGATGATERPTLSTEDILDAPSIRQFANNDTPLGRDRGGMKSHEVEDLIATHGEMLYPGISQINPADQADALRARLRSQISELEQSREAAKTATTDASKVSGGRRGKQYTQADVDNLLANYIPENATPEQVAKIMADTNIKTLRDTHTKLAHAAEQGLTTADGRPIPLRDDIRSLNILEERVKAADEAGAARVKEMADKATDEAGKKAAKDAAAAETEAAAARKADLEYERGVNRLSVALRIAAGDEAVLPGALKADILKMTPENMGIIMDDMIAGSGRFDEYADLISDAINKNNFEDLLDLRKAAAGDPELWKTGSKRIQDRAAKDLSKIEATQAGQMADAQSSEQIRQGMDQADTTAEAATLAADEARIKEEARIADEEKAITAQSPEELQKTLYDAIMADPSKADLFGIEGHVARVAANEKSPSSKAMKTRLQSLLVDAAEKVKINGVPKGFF